MKDRILLWNDDNHAPCVWINNKFAGVDLDKNNMNFIIVGNGMEIRFEKEISDEALIDVFDKDHNPIILKEIQNSVIMLEDKGYNLMSKKEEIENILKCLKSC